MQTHTVSRCGGRARHSAEVVAHVARVALVGAAYVTLMPWGCVSEGIADTSWRSWLLQVKWYERRVNLEANTRLVGHGQHVC